MVRQQHEVRVERVLFDRVRHLAGAHVEEVTGGRQIGARRDRLEIPANAIPRGYDRRELRDQIERGMHVRQVFAVRVDRREEA